ncbi:Succinyl-CoA ligase (ADP-forming) subunit beta [Candidatus Zixiibacteriota bacterium]|nr:Succinyl-CoA ligase (ADP-forming) subunit beta [candidate division Zixibacteria bacterium]
MRLYECEGKELLAGFGIPVPRGKLASNPEEVEASAAAINGPVMLKAQVLTGSRGKAGGIRDADSPSEAKTIAAELFSLKIGGCPVEKILVEQRLEIRKELYLGMTIDPILNKVVILVSATGGIEIDEVAEKNPRKIHRKFFDIDEDLFPFRAAEIAKRAGIKSTQINEMSNIIIGLFRLFRQYDVQMAEINPLVLTKSGQLIAADCRISVDASAVFRHPELAVLGIEDRHEDGAMTPREIQARQWGIPYLDLDGDVGIMPGGAGFGIMAGDLIHYFGGRPANFMDSSSGSNLERIGLMLGLLHDNPNVKGVFAARYGGISRCDDFARGVVAYLKEHGIKKPMVICITGNMCPEGMQIFEEARREDPQLFQLIEFYGGDTAIEEAARRAVELSKRGEGG